MNTVKIKVPYDQIQEVRKDLRKWEVRHFPFRRQESGMEIEMHENKSSLLILLKYSHLKRKDENVNS